jgi:acetyltransferase-like isoleucine patch superfamily enzyme
MTAPERVTGSDCTIAETATVGVSHGSDTSPPVLGAGAVVRGNAVIYDDVVVGDGFDTGHGALVREHSHLGDDVLVGTHAVVDGHADLGSGVTLQTGAYVPQESVLGDRVFLGPSAVLTNDPYPVREPSRIDGVRLGDDVTVGANATVLPDVEVGEGSFVAAGAVVTRDVPPGTLAVGAPAQHRELPEELEGGNRL